MRVKRGVVAPELKLRLSTGEEVSIADLHREGPVALVFVRHFGCVFCRERIAEFRRLEDQNIVFVTMGNLVQAEAVRQKLRSPHRFVCDPEQVAYEAFGLPKGSFVQMFNPTTFVRGFRAAVRGHGVGAPVGDPWQLGGAFVIDRTGRITWEKRATHAADDASEEEILRELARAAG
ncbi:MAG: peroxiredoxin-like family protein [Fimbriimonadaceae bacterium]